jgi:hypothetical protein
VSDLEVIARDAAEMIVFITQRQPNISKSIRRGLLNIAADLDEAYQKSVKARAVAAPVSDEAKSKETILEVCCACAKPTNIDAGDYIDEGYEYFACDECYTSPDEEIQDCLVALMIAGEEAAREHALEVAASAKPTALNLAKRALKVAEPVKTGRL